jgi:F/Y-rich N-terminus/SET domain/PHD-like zinc-binding domain/Bromodomain/PHD-finger/F/Y rich C-terminus
MSRLLTERCRGCVDYIKDNQQLVTCKECQGRFHVGCVDPSTTYKGQTVVKANSPDWTCYKCTTCDGCWQHDITYGAHTHVAPKSVTTRDGGDSVNLCTMCVTAYDAERFCPACAHTWNDVHYQKVKRQLKAESKRIKGCKRKRTDLYEAMEELEMDRTDPVEASWYNPDSPVWGYTAGTMLGCDGCNLWVHAGCGGLSQDEYDKTSSGKHDIYSTEFLCRGCCKRRTQEIIDKLEQEDKMYLFAIPVTEQMAPTYHDIIKNPMDLQTMAKRAKRAEDLNYAWVRENFELMVLNALTFNPFHSKVWNEAKRYYHDCMKEVFSVIGKGAPPGIYAKLVLEAFRQADLEKKKEEQRLEQDENTEKKDLVAGAQVANVTLPPMRDPLDQQSCISFQEVKLKPLEAHFGSWMECCFTCGSSGAMDTMLFCVDCGEAFHSFCAGVPIHSMHPSSVSGWRCPNCKVCEISGEVPQDETKMLFCEMCDRAFMCDLLDPPLSCAPPGLWVCGQCVDCKTCGNSSEAKGASLKHWSRDPQKCYRCGGCKGLVKEQTKIAKCVVCSCIWRKDDDDVAKCSTCAGRVHSDCDPVAEEFLLQRSLSSGRGGGTKKYCCPLCRRKEIHQPVLPGDLRKYVQESVWSAVLESDLAQPDSEFSIVEVYEKLTDSIDWRLREMSRQEYTTLIKEAVQMLGVIDQRKISSFDLVTACKTYRIDLPLWMAQRAARFMQSNKCCMVGKLQGDMTELPIESLVAIAKMAAAFLKVSCRALGLPSKKAVETYARMTALLIPPDECGMVGNPIDLVVVDGSFELIQNEEWSRDLEPQVLEAAKADPVLAGLFKSRAQKVVQNRKAPVDSFSYQTASPVCGWNRHIDPDDEENRWADPRACCLCRTCGDDDADGSVAPTADSLIIPHVGRLLPMSHGHWVHTSCALWSSEVYEAPGGGTINAMEKARSRGSQLKCFGCNRSGATVGCFKTNCSRNFHFPCAKACGGVFTVKQQMFCSEHQDSATDILERESIEQMKTLIIAEEKKVGVDKEPGDPNENLSCSRVGALVVQTLGEIEQKIDGFHNERYIMPNGYCATRIFWSGRTPKSRTVYICKIEMSANGNAVFVIIPGDDPSAIIRSKSVVEAYSLLTQRVAKANEGFFNGREIMHSKLPAIRGSTKKAFGLNGPQFFGFGLHHIRKILESLPGIEAVVAPLNEASPSYRFSYFQPSKDVIMDLQRKRAAVQAEKALENSSGSARTEGIKAMTRSGGSGRITRALVRSAVGEDDRPALGKQTDAEAKADRESNQVKYAALKAVPLTQRLAARRSHIHGWGLFTKVDIKKDGMIIEYMGEVVRQCIADKREKGYETLGIGSCYMFRLDLQRIVDATMIGCMARFMNHCCKNNAYAKVIGVDATMGMPADKKIVVFANRDINAGEEITYDYKFPVEDGSLRCTCGAPNCIGRMN